MKKTIAVKEIATFLYSSGDLTNEFFSNRSQLDGKHAHTFLQRKYNDDSIKEFYIKEEIEYKNDELTIHGFIDGVLRENDDLVIEEIKSTVTPLKKIDLDFHKEYLAQLMLYAYMYANQKSMQNINIRLTYIHIPEYELKKFDLNKSIEELKEFFFNSIDKYSSWIHLLEDNNEEALSTLKSIKFPFPNKREGQFDLMKATYYTLMHENILYAIAPTGIGKTMATIFPSLKTLVNKKQKLFYLTAKTSGKDIASNSIKILLDNGLKIKSLVITSKAKSCLLENKLCKPEKCPYAKGYFNRLRKALEDIYNENDIFDYDVIKKYSIKHNICPFEFSLDLSEFCDLIVCDYNYIFDPKAHLQRYSDEKYKIKLLIDEAHNLVSRSKDMYSSQLDIMDVIKLIDILSEFDVSLTNKKNILMNLVVAYDKLINEDLFYYSKFLDEKLFSLLTQIHNRTYDILSDNTEFEQRDEALGYFFNLKDLVDTSSFFSMDHLFIIKKIEDSYLIELKCMDASEFILSTLKENVNGVVFFSATMFPIKYYMDLISKGEGKYLSLNSPFEKERMDLIINDNISTKYKDREDTIEDIVDIIKNLVNSKKGNYIAFFPSYKYLELSFPYLEGLDTNVIIQSKNMKDSEKKACLSSFKDTNEPHLGLFVMGGSFSEGIDYQGDLLNGVVVVGVALPGLDIENNLLKEFFDEKYNKGFDYAYTYPGFNKVVQASGRVIRRKEDKGVVILIDQRYSLNKYQRLMPNHWSLRKRINTKEELTRELKDFWKTGE